MLANSQYMSHTQAGMFADWHRTVASSELLFREKCGVNFTPSRMKDFSPDSIDVCDASESTMSWCIPRFESNDLRELMNKLSSHDSRHILGWCMEEIRASGKKPLHLFWSLAVEAALQSSENPIFFAETLDGQLSTLKLPSRRLLRNQLFSKMLLLKLSIYDECTSDQKLAAFTSSLSSSDPILVSLRDVYSKLSKAEFHSTGKSKTGDLMTFMLSELFPFAIRDIPFAILKKLAMMCFDIDLFEDDYSRFWQTDINQDYHHFRTISSLHRWNDTCMMKNAATAVFDVPEQSPPDCEGTITLAYEAPWILPNLQNVSVSGSNKAQTRRKSTVTAHPTARTVKMEGRRQSYKPTASSSNVATDENAGAICLVQTEESDPWANEPGGFSIRRSSLSDLPGDWDFGGLHHADDKASKNGLNDVLEDLLGSPTRPSTQTFNSPDNQRSRKRSLSRSPIKLFGERQASSSPQTVVKKPCQREDFQDENLPPNNNQSIRDLLWNDEPPIAGRTRKGGTPKEFRDKYNI